MTWAIIVIAFSFFSVYGAAMWVRPSARDRRLTALRAEAMKAGLRVQMVRIADLSVEGRLAGDTLTVFAYRSYGSFTPDRSVLIQRTSGESGIHLPQGWTWGEGRLPENVRAEVIPLLEQAPEEVLGIELTEGYCGLIWDERNPEQLKLVQDLLLQLCQISSSSERLPPSEV